MFNVGDLVKIREDLEALDWEEYDIVENMLEYAGMHSNVERQWSSKSDGVNYCIIADTGCWSWDERLLEKVDEKESTDEVDYTEICNTFSSAITEYEQQIKELEYKVYTETQGALQLTIEYNELAYKYNQLIDDYNELLADYANK